MQVDMVNCLAHTLRRKRAEDDEDSEEEVVAPGAQLRSLPKNFLCRARISPRPRLSGIPQGEYTPLYRHAAAMCASGNV
jgi:hypothetical protein